ncbi:F0F1 ATP synthase subunit A [Cellulomonas sp. ATA003]|uniref:F0F1 ATP synthase subunit A n=1 Tax=Cellulomonas sp. ATA003 TaxID=3073064 RepID=UPI0028738099|nr:F0F1 ATP synthase subunit A [Cellulomonas sp. ATA003]WNB84957.1 F0F1 ATP synthase subunit A [Cellulomonas sp. ATA003]
MTTRLLAAAGHEEGGGFHAPTIGEFFPTAIAFGGTAFEFNRIMLVRVVAALALCLLFWLAARRATLVPGRGQGVAEIALDFVRVNIAREILGENARKYLPMLTTIFFAILAFNVTGIIPFLNIAGTSLIGLPVLLALWVYVMYLGAGVKAHHGVGGFLKSNLFPPGVPKLLYVLITPIEVLQVFVIRPATLALRLTANMIAGHLLLVLCFAATHFFFFEATGALKAVGALSLAAGLAFTLFELLVAALQAYIFALLAAVYISLSTEAH